MVRGNATEACRWFDRGRTARQKARRLLRGAHQDDVRGDDRLADLGAVQLIGPQLVRFSERHRVEDAVGDPT